MNLLLDETKYNIENVFFYEPVKNTIIHDSKFIRIIYSDENIILNCLYLKIDTNNKYIFHYLETIEKNILNKYNLSKNNINNYKLSNIREQFIYFISKNNPEAIVILKISGIWETNITIGLNYKFHTINNIFNHR